MLDSSFDINEAKIVKQLFHYEINFRVCSFQRKLVEMQIFSLFVIIWNIFTVFFGKTCSDKKCTFTGPNVDLLSSLLILLCRRREELWKMEKSFRRNMFKMTTK